MSLTNTTPAQKAANEIDDNRVEIVRFLDSQLRNMHNKIIANGPQDVLDAMGTNAGKAVQFYGQVRAAIASIADDDPNLKLQSPAPNADVFQVQSDGTVKFVPPPEPEPEPEPEAEPSN